MKIADYKNGIYAAVGISRVLIVTSVFVIFILFILHLLGCCIEHRYMRYTVCTMSLLNSLITGTILVVFIVTFKDSLAYKLVGVIKSKFKMFS
jgi:hypothetical protein